MRTLANKYQLKLFDIPLHIQAASKINMPIDDYLSRIPRTSKEFLSYFRGTSMAEFAQQLANKEAT